MTKKTKPTAVLVVFGKDKKGRAHASRLEVSDVEPVVKAAEIMGMRLLHAITPDEQALARELPEGRLFKTGRAFLPFCAAKLYRRLLGLVSVAESKIGAARYRGGEPPEKAAAGLALARQNPTDKRAGAPQGVSWAKLDAGALVLASTGPGEGWWEAVVTAAHKDDLLTLRWRDWPDDPEFARRSWQVAVLAGRRRQPLKLECS